MNASAVVRSESLPPAARRSGWLLPARAVLMFPRGKIKFVRPDGSIGKQPGHGNVFVGLGDVACAALLAVPLKIGVCWDRRSSRW